MISIAILCGLGRVAGMRTSAHRRELTLDHHAIPKFPEQRIDVAIKRADAADVRRREAKQFKYRTDGALELLGIGTFNGWPSAKRSSKS